MLFGMAARKEVFISATSADLGSYRQVVKDALLTLGAHPIEERNFPTDYRELQNLLTRLFCDSVARMERANYSPIRVAVSKGNFTAVFGVALKRLGYFFQDRDIELYDSGVKKRIFHIVRAHTRSDGTVVPFHWRGIKEFTWAGYEVKFTVPALDHAVLQEWDLHIYDERDAKP